MSPTPLYAFGSNGSGQLGIGHVDDTPTPTPCVFDDDDKGSESESEPRSSSSGDEPVRIVAGGNHTLVLFRSGAVYATGSNAHGRCGRDPASEPSLVGFRRVGFVEEEEEEGGGDGNGGRKGRIDRFSDVSATWEASFVVARGTGHVYAFGMGMKGELGLGAGCPQAMSPTRIKGFPPSGTSVVSISSSMGHTAVVLSNGEVYGWGGARKGQLGRHGVENKLFWSPHKVADIPFPAERISCGREFTVIAGSREDGKFVILGSDKWKVISTAPEDLKGYSTVATSWHGVYVQFRDGSLKAWGRDDRGQLPPSDISKPVKLAVGSEHALALLEDGRIAAFGWGEHGNCGPDTDAQGDVKQRWSEIQTSVEQGYRIGGIAIGAGCATSWIVISAQPGS
ncbi:hypothetical protein FQN54_002910 [Arachnomyces sp. PD_36]|nr:hypothetical protein FQN54_002910 [Arachnomyces sp. PD_36]